MELSVKTIKKLDWSMVLIESNIFPNNLTKYLNKVIECVTLLSKIETHFKIW